MGVYIWNDTWLPGSNTLLYVPFTDDLLDHSGNSVSLTTGGTISNTTLDGVKCASLSSGGLNTALLNTTGNWTHSIWVKGVPTGSGDNAIIDKGNNSRAVWTGLQGGGLISSISGVGYSSKVTVDTSSIWHCITVVRDSGVLYIYWDGVQKLTYSISSYESGISNNFGVYKREGSSTFGNGYISNWIVENKVRTAQEVADYYNQTKSLYGIS